MDGQALAAGLDLAHDAHVERLAADPDQAFEFDQRGESGFGHDRAWEEVTGSA